MELLILQAIRIILESIVYSYFTLKICKLFFNNNFSKKQKMLLTLVTLINLIITANLKNIFKFDEQFNFINSIYAFTMSFFMFKYILKQKNLKSILLVFILIIFLFITELISALIFQSIFNESAKTMAKSEIKINLVTILQMILGAIITFIFLRPLKIKKTYQKFINNKHLKLFTVSILICILPQLILFLFNIYNYPKSLLIMNIIQTIFISAVFITYVKNIIEKEKAETELINTEIHNKTLTGMLDGVRTIKHDYNNIIQALNGYIATQQYDKLKEHFDLVLAECNTINNMGVVDPKIFNDPAIYGVVGTKYFIALDKNIFFDFDIIDDISQINFSKPNLSRILGILLDNAIEATCKLEAKDRYIKLEIKYDKRKNADIIRVYNSYDKSVDIDLKKIFEKGESSKKIKSGIGLWEVKKLIKRESQAQIYASLEKKYFVQNIIIEKTDCLDDDDYEYELQLQE